MIDKIKKNIFWLTTGLLLIYFFIAIQNILFPFIASLVFSYFLNPLANILTKKFNSRLLAVLVIILSLFVMFSAIIIKIIPNFVEQIGQISHKIPYYQKYINEILLTKFNLFLEKLGPDLTLTVKNQASELINKSLNYSIKSIYSLSNSGMAVINVIYYIIFIPVLSFYLLKDWDKLKKNLYYIMPAKFKKTFFKHLSEIDLVISSYLRGQANVLLLMSLYYVTSLSITGLEYSLTLGIIAGTFTIIPYLGAFLSCLLSCLSCYMQFSDLKYLYICLGIFIFGNLLESLVLSPKFVGEKVGLHPAGMIFALMASGSLFGFWGIFFAVPLAATIRVIFKSLIKIYKSSIYYK